MATLNFIGNETGDLSEYASSSGTVSVQSTVKRSGTYALRSNPTTTGTGFAVIGTLAASGAKNVGDIATTACWARFYFRYATKPAAGDEPIACIGFNTNVNNDLLELRINSSGQLASYEGLGSSGTPLALLATGTTVLAANTWYLVEIKSDESDTADNVWEVRIGGVAEISGTFVEENFLSSFLRLGKSVNRNGNTVDFFYDDVLISDSAYPGAGQSGILVPNAAGNYQNATRGGADSGANWSQCDEVPPNSDTDYVITDLNTAHAETEAMQPASTFSIGGTINCVKAVAILKRDGATNGSVKLRTRSASTDTDASAFASTSAYLLIAKLFDLDPATGSAWTTGGIDAAEVGILENSAVNKTRMTVAYLMVDWTPSGGGGGGGNRRRRVIVGS